MPLSIDSAAVTALVSSVIVQAKSGITWNPADLEGFGVANIHTYRAEIAQTFDRAKLVSAVTLAVFEINMAQNKRKRILKGAKLQPHLLKSEVRRKAFAFYSNYTCDKTADHKIGKVCALKIATSFPEICASIYVIQHQTESVENIRDGLVKSLWAASINWDGPLQQENKESCRENWDSWGKGIGETKNSSGDVIKFDEVIYESAVADSILLLDLDGTALACKSTGYTVTEIDAWVTTIRSANVTVPDVTDIEPIDLAAEDENKDENEADPEAGGLFNLFRGN